MIKTYIKEGIHHFNFPFLGYVGDFGMCSIELHAGKNTGLNSISNKMFTVIVTQASEHAPALEHFIENITTDIKAWLEAHLSQAIDPKEIIWYQVLPYYNNGIWKLVQMEWSNKQKCYHEPVWTEIDPKLIGLSKQNN